MRLVTRKASLEPDLVRAATEAICLEGFRPAMRRQVQKGERFPRDHDLVKTYPSFFGLLLPLTELEEAS